MYPGSKRHRLSGSLLWVYVTISIFRGVGLSFHAFNESRPPWGGGGGRPNDAYMGAACVKNYNFAVNFFGREIYKFQA